MADAHKTSMHRASDLYLDWGLWSRFAYVDHSGESLGLLIEWKSSVDAETAIRLIPHGAKVSNAYLEPYSKKSTRRRFWALTVPIGALPVFLDRIDGLASRVELAAPIVADTPVGAFRTIPPSRPLAPTLFAVLDDGCAFANRRFRYASGTRIFWLWNQDPNAYGAPTLPPFPSANTTFGYGRQLSQADLDDIYPVKHQTQEEAYRHAKLDGLRRSAAHGTHVTDLLAGQEPVADGKSDIVFVQFPQRGVDDPSGLWLKRFAIDGLVYVLECVGADTTKVVANISWGPQTGPHDGHSLLEDAIQALVDEQTALGKTLIVTLPAGNSFGAQAHASVPYAAGGAFEWIIPPDGKIPAFVELWWPASVSPAKARLRVVPPSEAPVDIVAGTPSHPDGTWWASIKTVGAWTKALLIVHPTDGAGGVHRGRHGRWSLEIDPTLGGGQGCIDVYVARADHNMGAKRRAKASRLTDDGLQMARFVSAKDRYAEAKGSVIRRAGTLNGLATGTGTQVAAGYDAATGEPAPYSSSGPTRGTRKGPDYAFVTDRSPARPGVPGAGVRSGTKLHLIGTSTAAPQLGRLLASAQKPMPTPGDPARTGFGEEAPDPDVIGPS